MPRCCDHCTLTPSPVREGGKVELGAGDTDLVCCKKETVAEARNFGYKFWRRCQDFGASDGAKTEGEGQATSSCSYE
jgi:hypothetical protein